MVEAIALLEDLATVKKLMRVYVLLFNAGTDNEGIHTLKRKDDGQNVVLMFESEDDATRFGVMLEAQDFMTPSIECLDSEEIEAFCEDVGYECAFVPEGTLALPPEENAEKLDWTIDQSPEEKSEPEPESGFSSSDLDAIRRRLEGLL
jgi:hypothetical protein